MTDLGSFNAMVRQWADKQPAKYRLSALAFGYPCNRKTHSFDQTLAWVSKRSRKRPGEGVSPSTLNRHLKVFEASGVIEVERRRDGSRNKSSVYRIRFDRAIPANQANAAKATEDAERQAWLASLDIEPPEDAGHTDVPRLTDCQGCKPNLGEMDDAEVVKVHYDALSAIPS